MALLYWKNDFYAWQRAEFKRERGGGDENINCYQGKVFIHWMCVVYVENVYTEFSEV